MLKNLTPHPIVLRSGEEETTIPPSGIVARISSSPGELLDDTGPVPVYGPPVWGAVENLPARTPGVVLIVSALVAARCENRADVVSPGTGPADGAVRDESGRIVAVTRLVAAKAAYWRGGSPHDGNPYVGRVGFCDHPECPGDPNCGGYC